MEDPRETAQKAQELRAQLAAKGLRPERIADAAAQASLLQEVLGQLEAKGLTREMIFEMIDAQQSESLAPISLGEPSLFEVAAKLDEVLERLERIESRLGE